MSSPGPSKDDGAQKSPPTAPLNADTIVTINTFIIFKFDITFLN